jgi:DNA gyrase subunit B
LAKGYTSQDIQVLEGLDAVRMRPGMYIGSTGTRGLHHLLWEVVDNAIDEAANGYATTVRVELNKDGSASVEDDGRGIPVDIHEQMGVSAVEVVFTQLHAGGKFSGKNYAYSGGLHGVGASVVNALSRRMVVDVYADFSAWHIEFASEYDPEQKKVVAGRPTMPLTRVGGTRKHGSKVAFWPDSTVFEDVTFNRETVIRRIRELAYLNKGIRMIVADHRVSGEGREEEFLYEGGIVDYVRYLNQEKNVLYDKPVYIQGERDGVLFEAAIQATDGYAESIFSYVNNIPTAEGGTHETGFKTALTRVMNDHARRIGALKDKDANLSGEDFREGITAVIACHVKNPQFEGQTKGRLGNSEVRPIIEGIVMEKLSLFMEDLKNAGVAQKMVEKAVQAAQVREAARKAKDVARQKGRLEAAPLVGKLSSCTGRKAEENELFIVEGDSAGGSAKQARDRRFQAILPLRGKPLNAEKKRLDQVLANEEFRSIITALGTGIGEDFALKNLKYDKVIILADADQDGAHIRAILMTFFFRYMKELITEGHLYIGMPPLYRVENRKNIFYCYDELQLQAATKKAGKGYTVQRYKGLGEMDADQLWDTTMDPARRVLMRVDLEDSGADAERLVTVLMGDKVEPRKEYIANHANFNKDDRFEGRVM